MKHLFTGFVAALLLHSATLFAKEKTYTAFEVKVSGHGQPVILIPGATCSGGEWKETVARYGNKYEFHVLTLGNNCRTIVKF